MDETLYTYSVYGYQSEITDDDHQATQRIRGNNDVREQRTNIMSNL